MSEGTPAGIEIEVPSFSGRSERREEQRREQDEPGRERHDTSISHRHAETTNTQATPLQSQTWAPRNSISDPATKFSGIIHPRVSTGQRDLRRMPGGCAGQTFVPGHGPEVERTHRCRAFSVDARWPDSGGRRANLVAPIAEVPSVLSLLPARDPSSGRAIPLTPHRCARWRDPGLCAVTTGSNKYVTLHAAA